MEPKIQLVVFLLLRADLDFLVTSAELLQYLCRLSSPLERKIPRDPLSSLPVRQDLSSPVRQLSGCFEATDFKHLATSLQEAFELLSKFEVKST